MKTTIFLLLISLSAHAEFYGAISDIERCSNDSGVDLFSDIGNCQQTKNSECIVYPGGDCREMELIDNEVVDFVRKENVLSCASEDECKALEAVHLCDKGKVIRTESEVYCAVEMMKKDGKKLVGSELKKEQRRAERQAQKDAEKVREEKKKAFKFKGSTIKELGDELNEWLEAQR